MHAHKFKEQLAVRLREGLMIVLAAVALYLLLGLVSFDPKDAGWSQTGIHAQIHNQAGRYGAWFSDLLFSLFGIFAFLVPIFFALRAVQVFRERNAEPEWHWGLFLMRSSGVLLSLPAGAGLASIHFQAAQLPEAAGGILGQLVADYALPAFNYQGGTLLLLAVFLIGITLFTNLSWFALMDWLGKYTLLLCALVAERCKRLLGLGRARLLAWREGRRAGVTVPRPRERQIVSSRTASVRQEPSLAAADLDGVAESLNIPVLADRMPACVPEPAIGAVPDAAPRVAAVRSAPLKKAEPILTEPSSDTPLPELALLDAGQVQKRGFSAESLEQMSRLLEAKLREFNVKAEVVAVHPGPVITRFEIQPAPGIKVSKITNLAKDIARSLAVMSVRVVEVIPGKSTVGIEIPNERREIISFREVMDSPAYGDAESPVTLALGHDIAGQPVTANLAKMPHLLVAGTTGSGKSVGINSMILSMLFKASPEEVRLIMVDPKMLELSVYDGIPHLLAPVVTDMKEAANALRWCVAEMERRYKLMAAMGVRNLAGFNRKVKEAAARGEPIPDPLYDATAPEGPALEPLPFIVVVIDEFADMMMIVGKKVEELIARIAQKARAAGIHLILATQRPSVDVITGLIKANIPTRISFQVSSKIDSRTVLDQGGAEQLLGHGDMLYLPPGTSVPIRVHGAFVSDDEVHRVVADWKARGEPRYIDEVLQGVEEGGYAGDEDGDSEQDPLYDEAVAFVIESGRASISAVQRKLKIGYNRAARMVEAMEAAGVVSAMGSNGARDVLVPNNGH